MERKNRVQQLDIETREATQQDVPTPGASTIGVSGLTAVPSAVPNDAPLPLPARDIIRPAVMALWRRIATRSYRLLERLPSSPRELPPEWFRYPLP